MEITKGISKEEMKISLNVTLETREGKEQGTFDFDDHRHNNLFDGNKGDI